MTTCPSCGSETAAGATCVVCGAEPTTATVPALDGDTRRDDDPGRDDRADTPSADGPMDPADDDDVVAAVGVPVMAGAPSAPPDPGGPGAGPPPAPDAGTPHTPHGPPASPMWPATPSPHPDAVVITESSRNWAMIAHLSALVAAGVGGLSVLGPLVVWLVRKDQDRFVRHHAVEALNFNLSVMLYMVLGIALAFTVVGLVVVIPAAIIGFFVWFVTSIVAAVKAQRGEGYRYPLTIRLIRE